MTRLPMLEVHATVRSNLSPRSTRILRFKNIQRLECVPESRLLPFAADGNTVLPDGRNFLTPVLIAQGG